MCELRHTLCVSTSSRRSVGVTERSHMNTEGQAVQPFRKQARLGVRAGLVEPVNDVLNRPAVTPGGFQQSLCRVGVLLVMSS
jgi:hypothetical protein